MEQIIETYYQTLECVEILPSDEDWYSIREYFETHDYEF